MVAGLPLLFFASFGVLAVAEIFHEGSFGVAEPEGDGRVGGFVGELLGTGPGVVSLAGFRGFT